MSRTQEDETEGNTEGDKNYKYKQLIKTKMQPGLKALETK